MEVEIRRQTSISSMGRLIKTLRKEQGLTQTGLASRACISRTTIARLECGIFQALSVAKLESLAEVLGIDLKTLMTKSETLKEPRQCRGDVNQEVFSIDYPKEGFRIISLTPKTQEFFFGKLEVQARRTIESFALPHPDQICLHCLEGKLLLVYSHREYLLKKGDHFMFAGKFDYEIYNPDQLRPAVTLLMTYPSFLPF